METAQILCTLKDVPSFLGVYPSDILPPSITRSATLIVNTDPHTASGTHWLAIHLNHDPTLVIFSIPMAYGLSSPLSLLSCVARAPSGNKKQPGCKNGPVQSAGNTVVYSYPTYTVGTRRASLWASLIPPPLTARSAAYSHQSLERCVRNVPVVSVALHL